MKKLIYITIIIIGTISLLLALKVSFGPDSSINQQDLQKDLRSILLDEGEAKIVAEAKLHKHSIELIPKLVNLLNSKSTEDRELAVAGFRALGKRAEPAIPQLLDSLGNPDVAFETSLSLAAVGKSGLLALTSGLTNSSDEIRLATKVGIDPYRRNAEKHIPWLIESLRNEEVTERIRAVRLLGEFGTKARTTIPELRGILSTITNEELQLAVSKAIQQIEWKPPERWPKGNDVER